MITEKHFDQSEKEVQCIRIESWRRKRHILLRAQIHNGKETKCCRCTADTKKRRREYAENVRRLRREFNFHLLKDDDVSILCVETHSYSDVSGYITFPNEALLIQHYPVA